MKSLIMLGLLISGLYASALTADDIINKNIEATGGADKWAKVFALRYSANYVLGPGMLAPVNALITTRPFKAYYSDFTWQGMTGKTCMRGDSGWNYQPFGGKRETDPMSPDEIRSLKLDDDPQGLLFNYKQKGYNVDYLGTDDMDGTDVYKLRLTTKEGDMVYFYIDQETYYILKIVKRMKYKDRETKSYSVYSDFKKTDYGVTMPFTQQNVDENGNEQGGPVTISKVEINGPVDAAMFEQPKNQGH